MDNSINNTQFTTINQVLCLISVLCSCQNLASSVFVGTPPRITRDTIDFSKCDVKHGDDSPIPFSFMSERVKVDVSKILFSDCHCIAQVCFVRFEQIWKKLRKQVFLLVCCPDSKNSYMLYVRSDQSTNLIPNVD